jgi:hypothetical protein
MIINKKNIFQIILYIRHSVTKKKNKNSLKEGSPPV